MAGSMMTSLAIGLIAVAAFLVLLLVAGLTAGSLSAANAFGCAAEAGFGEAYYNALFANHTLDWSDSQLLALAQQVNGSVPDTFSNCVTQRSHEDWVNSINDAASAASPVRRTNRTVPRLSAAGASASFIASTADRSPGTW